MQDTKRFPQAGMTRSIAALAACACSILAGSAPVAAQATLPCRYEVAHIIQAPLLPPPIDEPVTAGLGISPNGQYVCGRFRYPPGDNRPFIFDTITQQFTAPTMPPDFYEGSFADVNDNGLAVGTGGKNNVGQRGFVYKLSTGQWTELLPLPGGAWSAAMGVNSSGTVCGWRSIGPGTNPQTAYRWSAENGFEDLGLINDQSTNAADINDNNVVTGWFVKGVQHPFIWSNGEIKDLGTINGFGTVPFEINSSNQVCGRSSIVPNGLQPHAFLWSNGLITDLGTLPGHELSQGIAIASDGTVFGFSRKINQPEDRRAVMWNNSQVVDLNTKITVPYLFLQECTAVALNGMVVVGYIHLSTSATVVLNPVYPPTGDITNDCKVNVPDLLMVLDDWNKTDSAADINNDEVVDLADLLLVVANWTG